MRRILTGLGISLCMVTGGNYSIFAQEQAPPVTPVPAPQPVVEIPLPQEALSSAASYFSLLSQENNPAWEDTLKNSCASPYMGEIRRKQLQEFQNSMKIWISPWEKDAEGKFRMETATSRVEGDLACAVIYFFSSQYPMETGILPVMFFKKEGNWRVTPFISSFDNTDMPLDKEMKLQATALEEWGRKEAVSVSDKIIDKGEARLLAKIGELRAEMNLKDATPEQILNQWLDGMRKEDVLKVTAVSEIIEKNQPNVNDRLKQAYSYVLRKNKEQHELPVTFALMSPSVLLVPVGEQKDGISLGLLDLDGGFLRNNVAYIMNFNIRNLPNGEGRILVVPRECRAQEQSNVFEDSGLSDEELNKVTARVMSAFAARLPEKQYETPLQFAEDYAKAADKDALKVQGFLSMKDRELFKDPANFDELKQEWGTNRYAWNYPDLMEKENADWKKNAFKSSKLLNIDDSHALFLMCWNNPAIPLKTNAVHTVPLVKTDKGWVWKSFTDDFKFDIREAKDEFLNQMKLETERERFKDLALLKKEQLPPIPDKPLMAEAINAPDESLKQALDQELAKSDSLEHLFEGKNGVTLQELKRFPYPVNFFGRDGLLQTGAKNFLWENDPKITPSTTICLAAQNGDWGMLGLAFRSEAGKEVKGYVMGVPFVRIGGKWSRIYTSDLRSGIRAMALKASKLFVVGYDPFLQKLDDNVFIPMLQTMVDKRLLPKEVYAEIDKMDENKKAGNQAEK